MKAGGEAPECGAVVTHVNIHAATAALQAELDGFHGALLVGTLDAEAVGHHVEHLLAVHVALALHPRETAGRQPLLHLLRAGVGRQLDREAQHQARVVGLGAGHQLRINALGGVMPDGQGRLAVEKFRGAGIEELQVVIQLRHRAHRGPAGAHRVGLVDGDRGWDAVDLVDRRAVHAVQELPGIGGERLHVATLALGVQGVEDETGLARAAGPGDDGEFRRAQIEVEVLEVVLPSASDADQTVSHCRGVPKRQRRAV